MTDRFSTSHDRYFRLRAEGAAMTVSDRAIFDFFNRDVAHAAGTAVENLPVTPVRPWMSYPYAIGSEYRGFTLATSDALTLVKGCARDMGLSNNYIPQLQV